MAGAYHISFGDPPCVPSKLARALLRKKDGCPQFLLAESAGHGRRRMACSTNLPMYVCPRSPVVSDLCAWTPVW